MKKLNKNTALIHISQSRVPVGGLFMEIYNLLLYNALNNDFKNREYHELALTDLFRDLGPTDTVTFTKDRQYLLNGLLVLRNTEVKFDLLGMDQKTNWEINSSLLAEVGIARGRIIYSIGPLLREKMIESRLYAPLNLEHQRKFSCKYSRAIYELCADQAYRGRTTKMYIPDFREIIGVPEDKYLEYKYLSTKVINQAKKEINEITEIEIEPVTIRMERKVTFIYFTVHNKLAALITDIPDSDINQIRRELIDFFGVHKTKAFTLSVTHDKKVLSGNIEYAKRMMQKGEVKNASGYVIQAIEKNYAKIEAQ